MIDTVVGNYKVVEKLGEGGMGTVYRGVDQMVERSVAIKVLRSDIADNPEVVERFRSEAIALARLNHAAIATLYSFFREGDRYFMAMEFVPGETLERKIQREGALSWQQAVEIMMWALDGVKHAHQMGILHRDLKPANIMITPDGRVKVTDFGIARVLNTMRLTREARVVGTLEYLAPERALGRPADARSDLYSLGVVFYEMVTGKLPFQSDSDFALMRAQIEQAPRRPKDVGVSLPAPIEAALMKALAKDPEDRYPSAEAFAADFRQAVRATGVPLAHVKATRQAQETVAAVKQVDWRVAGVVAAGLIAVGAVGIGISRIMQPKPVAQATQPVENPGAATAGAGGSEAVVPIAPPVVIPTAPPPAAETPTAPPPEPAVAPAPAPVRPRTAPPRRDPSEAARAALDEAGVGPLPFAAILKALRTGSGASPTVTQAVQLRGVNFRATPDQLIELRVAGASDALLHAVVAGYRGAPAAPPVSAPPATEPAPVAPPAPTPAPAPPPVVSRPAPRRLTDIRKLYVVPSGDELDKYLREEIRTELGSRVDLANTAGQSDAQLRVEVVDEGGNRVVGAAGRIFGLKGKKRAIVRITEPQHKTVLWSAEAGDNKAVLGAFSDGAKRLASRIAKQLREDWSK